MFDKLEAYLEEISHFLSGRAEREEILSEIKSHVLEKAEREYGQVTAESLDKVISAYGPARRLAEKYLDGRPIIAPAYKRYLFRYTALVASIHFFLTVIAVVFKKSFVIFPFVFMPRMSIFESIMYLPTAFLTDLGFVALILYLITQSGKEINLPWPKFAVDLDEVKPPKKNVLIGRIATVVAMLVMLAITDAALYLYFKYHAIFFADLKFSDPRPLFIAEAGRRLSLIVIAMLAAGTLSLLAKVFTSSRWVDVVSSGLGLVLIGLLLRQPFDNPFAVNVPAALLPKIKFALTFTLLFIAAVVTIDLIKNLILIGRKKLRR